MSRTPHKCPVCEGQRYVRSSSTPCAVCDASGIVWEPYIEPTPVVPPAPTRTPDKTDSYHEVVGVPDTAQQQPPACGNCKHWDWEEGQAALFRNPDHAAFAQAAQILRPAHMMKRVKVDEDGAVVHDDNGQPLYETTMPMKTGWEDVGACLVHEEGRFRMDHCDRYEPKQ